MFVPELLSTVLTGLFMGWLMGVIWQSQWLGRLIQLAVGLVGALLAYWIFSATSEFALGWLGALVVAALGAMLVSIVVNMGSLLAGGGPSPLPLRAADDD